MSVVYVSCAGDGEIRVLALDAERAALAPLQQVGVGGAVMPLAVSPDRRFLYAARRSEPIEALSYAIEAPGGTLRHLGSAALPDSMAYIAADRSGRFLFSASYGGHRVAVSAIGADGVVRDAAHQVLATEPHAHAIQADLANRHVYATSLGGDNVSCWRFDAEAGTLTANDPFLTRTPPKAGPRHFVWDAPGRRLYLLCELDGTLRVFDHDAQQGSLHERQSISLLPPGFAGEPWAADLRLTPDGRRLYATERRSSTLAAFAVEPGSGELRALAHLPTETTPRSLAIDPSGRCLVVAGQDSNAVALYRIDAATGLPSLSQRCDVGRQPCWVEIVEPVGPSLA
jgi:6-phosphogluconolactonase